MISLDRKNMDMKNLNKIPGINEIEDHVAVQYLGGYKVECLDKDGNVIDSSEGSGRISFDINNPNITRVRLSDVDAGKTYKATFFNANPGEQNGAFLFGSVPLDGNFNYDIPEGVSSVGKYTAFFSES